jgi:hypothetical protein
MHKKSTVNAQDRIIVLFRMFVEAMPDQPRRCIPVRPDMAALWALSSLIVLFARMPPRYHQGENIERFVSATS